MNKRALNGPGSRRAWWIGMAILSAAAFLPWLPRLSPYSDRMGLLDRWSYDWLHALRSTVLQPEVLIIEIDQASVTALGQGSDGLLDRRRHVQLLKKLAEDGAALVVMDVFFGTPGLAETDAQLAAAMRQHGRVVIGLDLAEIDRGGVTALEPIMPVEPIRSSAAGLGLVQVKQDGDGVVRRQLPELEAHESLPWVAARLARAAALSGMSRLEPRWLHYTGPTWEALPRIRYADALEAPAGFFRGRYVFVGGSPRIKKPGEQSDMFRTPFSSWDVREAPGVDLVATSFLNLLHGTSLARLSPSAEFLLLAILALGQGIAWTLQRRTHRTLCSLLPLAGVTAFGLALPSLAQTWFSWVIPLLTLGPLGLAGCVWRRQVVAGPHEVIAPAASQTLPLAVLSPVVVEATPVPFEPPAVADHNLLRRVGTGAYGEVWLARNAVGILHAVKIIHRRAFESADPFEREFRGITRFMPISRSHPGFVHVLQVGPEPVREFFYYVMELADDVAREAAVDWEKYSPDNLAKLLKRRRRLAPDECLELGLRLADALEFLHQSQLIHRDIKPSNIIFVVGQPKLADIGLVTRIAGHPREVSFLGTRGYIAPEGPGTASADIYSLGKVLYEAYTGLDREEFPSLPTSLLEAPSAAMTELNQVVLKACEVDPRQRYGSAAEFHSRLASLRSKLRSTGADAAGA